MPEDQGQFVQLQQFKIPSCLRLSFSRKQKSHTFAANNLKTAVVKAAEDHDCSTVAVGMMVAPETPAKKVRLLSPRI